MRLKRWMPYAVTGDLDGIEPDTLEDLRSEWETLPSGDALPFGDWLREYVAEELEAMLDETTVKPCAAARTGFDIVSQANQMLAGGAKRWGL